MKKSKKSWDDEEIRENKKKDRRKARDHVRTMKQFLLEEKTKK